MFVNLGNCKRKYNTTGSIVLDTIYVLLHRNNIILMEIFKKYKFIKIGQLIQFKVSCSFNFERCLMLLDSVRKGDEAGTERHRLTSNCMSSWTVSHFVTSVASEKYNWMPDEQNLLIQTETKLCRGFADITGKFRNLLKAKLNTIQYRSVNSAPG